MQCGGFLWPPLYCKTSCGGGNVSWHFKARTVPPFLFSQVTLLHLNLWLDNNEDFLIGSSNLHTVVETNAMRWIHYDQMASTRV